MRCERANPRGMFGELADQLIDGDVRVYPYMIGRATPCSHCSYRSVCRFEPGLNRYHVLPTINREEVLQRIATEVEDA